MVGVKLVTLLNNGLSLIDARSIAGLMSSTTLTLQLLLLTNIELISK